VVIAARLRSWSWAMSEAPTVGLPAVIGAAVRRWTTAASTPSSARGAEANGEKPSMAYLKV